MSTHPHSDIRIKSVGELLPQPFVAPNTPPVVAVGDAVVYVVSRWITSPATVTAVHGNEYGQLDLACSAVVYDDTDFDLQRPDGYYRLVTQKVRPETRGKVRYSDPAIIWSSGIGRPGAPLPKDAAEDFQRGVQHERQPLRVRRTVPFQFTNLEPGTWFLPSRFSYEIRCIKAAWDQRIAANQRIHHDETRRSYGPFADFPAAHARWWKEFRRAGPPGMVYKPGKLCKWDAIDPEGAMGVTMWARRPEDAVATENAPKKEKKR
jgi:hypothetical protein